jgi:PPP family 3-phenylpropionic acid transporter
MATTDEPQRPQLLPLRAFYFFSFGGLGALFPYLPLLLSYRGLDPAQISWVMVLSPVANLVVPPLWGTLADKLGARLVLLRLASLGCGLSVLLLLPVWGLWGSLLAMALVAFFRAPLTSLADAAVYSTMGGRRASFSSVRVWGSLGFGVFVLTLGLARGSVNPPLLLGVTCAIYLLAGASLLPMRRPPYLRERDVVRQTVQILTRAPMLLLLLGSAVYYTGHSTYDVFFPLHARALGHGEDFVGVAWAVGIAVEIGVMLLAPAFLRRFRSAWLLAFCGAAAAARWLLLATLTGYVPLAALQALHGVTFGLWYLALVQFIQNRAPEHLRTSLQSMSLSSMGLGMVAGYLSGGAVFKQRGGTWLYREAGCCAAAAALLYVLCGLVDRREARRADPES